MRSLSWERLLVSMLNYISISDMVIKLNGLQNNKPNSIIIYYITLPSVVRTRKMIKLGHTKLL